MPDIERAIANLDGTSSPGPDKIMPIFMKNVWMAWYGHFEVKTFYIHPNYLKIHLTPLLLQN